MLKASRRVLGVLVAVLVFSQLHLAAYADESGLGPFTKAELAKQRKVLRVLMSRINDDMNRSSFEQILGEKLTAVSLGNDAGMGGYSNDYRTIVRIDKYFYSFDYVERHFGSSTLSYIVASFEHSGDMDVDDADCLSLSNIKQYAEEGGWKVDSPYVEWVSHGIRATKGRQHFEATTPGGIPEGGAGSDPQDIWISKYGLRGCVSDLRIEQTL